MREIDAWTDIFESQKLVISNSNASKPGSRVKDDPCLRPKTTPIKTWIDDNRPKILLARRAHQWWRQLARSNYGPNRAIGRPLMSNPVNWYLPYWIEYNGIENTVGNRENVGFHHFLIFPQYFKNLFSYPCTTQSGVWMILRKELLENVMRKCW